MTPDHDPIAAPVAASPARLLGQASAAAFGPACGPFDPQPFVLVDLDDRDCPAPPDCGRLGAWLQRQPCPVIGLGERIVAPELADACDLVVAERASLASVLTHVVRAPLAAMTLVQLLRATATLPRADALTVESLAFATLQSGPEFAEWSAAHPPDAQRLESDDGPPVLIARDGARLMLRLNRPTRRNAMTIAMRDALVEAFEFAAADASIETLEVDAAGACFCTGGALEEFGTAPDPARAHAIRSLRLPAAALLRTRATSHFRVHGACIGSGIELAAFAGRLTAAPSAFFQLPELRFGLLPGAGGCVSLPRRIGRQRTAYLALSGRRINAATALEWGLVDAIEEVAARPSVDRPARVRRVR